MKLSDWLANWKLDSLKLNSGFLEAELSFKSADKNAAWELYIELLTRIATQKLPENHGDEKSALDSVYSLFPTTREIIKRNGRECIEFSKIAIVVLNQIVRPFTAKWHKESLDDAFSSTKKLVDFRNELSELQEKLKRYTQLLADMAGVEDITNLENL